ARTSDERFTRPPGLGRVTGATTDHWLWFLESRQEVQHPAPRVCAGLGELVVLAVEERVWCARIRHELVVTTRQGLVVGRYVLGRDRLVRATEQAEHGDADASRTIDRRWQPGGRESAVEADGSVEAELGRACGVEGLRPAEAEPDHRDRTDTG